MTHFPHHNFRKKSSPSFQSVDSFLPASRERLRLSNSAQFFKKCSPTTATTSRTIPRHQQNRNCRHGRRADAGEEFENPEAPRKKRNCGRCGAHHGGRSPSIRSQRFEATAPAAGKLSFWLKVESEEGWLIVLNPFEKDRFQPLENSLKSRVRSAHRAKRIGPVALPPSNTTNSSTASTASAPGRHGLPSKSKSTTFMLRYRGAAERSFHREYRALEAHYKIHNLLPKPEPEITRKHRHAHGHPGGKSDSFSRRTKRSPKSSAKNAPLLPAIPATNRPNRNEVTPCDMSPSI